MAPVTRIASEHMWQQILIDGLIQEASPLVEVDEPDVDEPILADIPDLLGCFCVQTGALFG